MKVFLLKEADFDELIEALAKNPTYGTNGGSPETISPEDQLKYQTVHRFYNYHVRRWIDKQKAPS